MGLREWDNKTAYEEKDLVTMFLLLEKRQRVMGLWETNLLNIRKTPKSDGTMGVGQRDS